ncbi:MAG TPA: sulfite exporter TauE/SafE family protein [Actinoplanes sp.]|nr:sulfite exporter TauE/SafE family protein [Actinoplanes sp.]
MSAWWVLLLAGAGVLAGISGSVGGLASLASYPALLLAGLAPTAANVTNTVALVAITVGAAGGSRPELVGQGRYIWRLCAVSVLGGASGAALLLTTPAGVFEMVVPWLIAGGSVVLLLGPRLRRAFGEHRAGHVGAGMQAAVFLISVYAGYFGAAAGVLMLALLSAVSQQSLARINAAKNLIMGAANAVAAGTFAVIGPVHWVAALALGAGSLVGGMLGPRVVRRLPAGPLRVAIGVAGLGLAVKLAVDAGTF